MKKNYFLLMAMLLFAVVGFTSCSDDDEGGISGNAAELLIGEWQAIWYEGYEFYDGHGDEWDESLVDDGIYYTFYADGTVDMEGYTERWSVSGNVLIMDGERYTITTLNANTLVLEYRESYEGEEYYEKVTFERVE